MKSVNVQAAKTKLSQLLAPAEAGEDFVIARGGKAVAKPVRVQSTIGRRRFGALKGNIRVGATFFEPLTESELADWE